MLFFFNKSLQTLLQDVEMRSAILASSRITQSYIEHTISIDLYSVYQNKKLMGVRTNFILKTLFLAL